MSVPEIDVLVVGNVSLELVADVERLPFPGQTVLAREFRRLPGGKGTHLAMTVARLEGRAGLIGKVGRDSLGDELESLLRHTGIAELRLFRDDSAPTGLSLVAIDRDGQRQTVAVPGASTSLLASEIREAKDLFAATKVVLLQLAASWEAVDEAVRLARDFRKLVILNPSPAQPIPEQYLRAPDFLTLGAEELAVLSGKAVRDRSSAEFAAAVLLEKGARNLVVTLGQDGCLYCGPQGRLHEPAYPVEARGPMVAAEVFDGALALCLARGKSLREALQFASAAAAVCATGPGAQPSISWREKVEACLASSLSARNKRSE